MHYGREFLSIQMWDSEKAQNLRAMCVEVRFAPHLSRTTSLTSLLQTLASWGMGL